VKGGFNAAKLEAEPNPRMTLKMRLQSEWHIHLLPEAVLSKVKLRG
jgi:hypothetical protein